VAWLGVRGTVRVRSAVRGVWNFKGSWRDEAHRLLEAAEAAIVSIAIVSTAIVSIAIVSIAIVSIAHRLLEAIEAALEALDRHLEHGIHALRLLRVRVRVQSKG
jgi:hypothetical protein